MPERFFWRKVRSKEGKALDKAYARHEIGWAYYKKVWDKPKYWTYK
jgi:hypothetical protein